MAQIEMIYADETSVAFKRGNLIFTANNGKAKLLELKDLKKRIFGPKGAVFSEYGVILPPCSYNIFERKS